MAFYWPREVNWSARSRQSNKRFDKTHINSLAIIICIQLILSFHSSIDQVQCTSSYIDDYFLPTAKLALNKLQQSLAPSASGVGNAAVGGAQNNNNNLPTNSIASADSLFEGPSQQVLGELANDFIKSDSNNNNNNNERLSATRQQSSNVEPNKNEFVSLNAWQPETSKVANDEAQFKVTQNGDESSNKKLIDREQNQEVVISSTESVSEDPTSIANIDLTNEPASSSESTEIKLSNQSQEATLNNIVQSSQQESQENSSSTTTTTEPSTTVINSEQAIVVDEASIKETENDAIAAVDASIGFGGSDLFGLATDTCYDEYGNARFCEPEFENIAFERQVEASSECGRSASRFCTTNYVNEHNDQIRNCHICDAQHPKKRHPSSYLTDMNNANAPTCWVSAPIGSNSSWPADLSSESGAPLNKDNVTLTLNFDKRYEITYVSMQFCSLKADSLAIYKSQDFGRTWTPYQFYSSQCSRVYQRPSVEWRSSAVGQQQKSSTMAGVEKIEAICVNSSSSSSGGQASQSRIAFSTLDSIQSQLAKTNEILLETQIERLPQLQDWMTATNIRIVLDRHQTSWIQSSLAQHHLASSGGLKSAPNSRLANDTTTTQQRKSNNGTVEQQVQQSPLEASLVNPSDTYNYALADLTIGGRCKCNGHASRCVHNDTGHLQCDCRHNTAGQDCERCAPFHFDRPWQRATQLDAHPCQPCQCNGHSRKCKFDPELYQLSGKRSGGVCINCRDNTAGRHCHYCKEGYTRDHSKPMSDKEACKPCDCHPVGSLGRVCNQTTGQCPCKEGVTGLECNRCSPGYQQSSSPSEPCIKLPENGINYEPTIETASGDNLGSRGQLSPANNQLDGDTSQEPSIWTSPDNEVASQSLASDSGKSRSSARLPTGEANIEFNPAADANNQFYGHPDDEVLTNSFGRSRPRPDRPHHWIGGVENKNTARSRHNYYGGSASKHNNNRLRPFENSQNDELSSSTYDDDEPDDGQARYSQNRRIFGDQSMPVSVYYQQQGASSGSKRTFNPARNDDYFSDGPVASVSYAAPPLESVSDEQPNNNNFNNHIQQSAAHNNLRASWQFSNHFRSRGQHGIAGNSVSRRRFESQQQQQQHLNANSLACAGCQSNSKRLNFRQFCQLEYAIKAQVLNKLMADDWTRYDVEILDVFRSPNTPDTSSSSSSASFHQGSMKHNYAGKPIDNFIGNENSLMSIMQADDPIASSNSSSKQVETDQQLKQQQQPTSIHRLNIGSVQAIWVPTEDVVCRCPRLKLQTTYLLMGSVDAKEHSLTSIQLDRHGVAVEWKIQLQERLIRYQRRHSKGRC